MNRTKLQNLKVRRAGILKEAYQRQFLRNKDEKQVNIVLSCVGEIEYLVATVAYLDCFCNRKRGKYKHQRRILMKAIGLLVDIQTLRGNPLCDLCDDDLIYPDKNLERLG